MEVYKSAVVLTLAFLIGLLCGCGVSTQQRKAIPPIISSITAESCEQELRSLLEIGPRYCGDAEQTQATVEYLESRLQQLGYEVTREPAGSWFNVEQVNLLAELRGQLEPSTIVEIGAHYDTVRNCAGADDNGSGVVGVLEVARVLASYRPEKTVRFCLFAAEEVGLKGSKHHVERILEDSTTRVDGLLNLEMIGYSSDKDDSQDAPIRIPILAWLPERGNFILVAGNFSSGGLGHIFERCIDRYVPKLKYFSANRIAGFFGDAARSDHSSYWRAGLRSIMLTDTANFRNPHYHRSSDTIETIDFDFMSRVTRASAATIIEWGGYATEPITLSSLEVAEASN